jgi:protein O-GlcNAc transferase
MSEGPWESPPPPPADHPLMAQAAALHTGGHLDEAAELYRRILVESPANFDATHLLGVIALQKGRFEDALRLIHAALGIEPQNPSAIANLGTSYMHGGQLESALQWFESALGLQPDSRLAITNVGTVLHNMGRHVDAVPLLRRAYLIDRNVYAVCILLGASLAEIGEAAQAAEMFEAATQADPANPEGWENLAKTLNFMGQPERSCEVAEHALSLKPTSAVALATLGKGLMDQGRFAEAIESYQKSIDVAQPTAERLAEYGSALLASGLNSDAIEQFEQAMRLDGTKVSIRLATTMAHLKPIYDSEKDTATSRSEFTKALEGIESWCRGPAEVREPFMAVGTVQPFYLAYQPLNNRELLSRYGSLCASWMATLPGDISTARSSLGGGKAVPTDGRLRIGIVSAHVHQHSVWNAITRGWIYNIDHTRFAVHLFKLDSTSDRETELARNTVAHFEDRPKTLADWIPAIRDQELDVIIYPEIGMHPLTLQLACMRLATVQAAAWGHPETTGLPTIDLYLSAQSFEPGNAHENYSEALVPLPNLGVCVAPLHPKISKPGLRSLNLPHDEPLLLCPGAPFKYSPLYDVVWVDIARKMKKKLFSRGSGGRLVFFKTRNEVMDHKLESRLRAAFERAELIFDEHVSIIPMLERSRFFGLMHESALMLDTPGFSGFNTAIQAIECGLPVLAFEGDFMRGRLASGIMRRLSLPEMVATTTEEFVQTALDLAKDAGRRRQIRSMISERRDILFHDMAPVRALEQHLTEAVTAARAVKPLS